MNPIDFLLDQNNRNTIRRDVPTPLYHLLYSLMKDKIINGEFDHGAKMPTEYQLADAFDVSRITAKRALDELAEDALVERRRGRGTYVTHKYVPKPVQAPLTGMLESLRIMARDTEIDLLVFEHEQPNDSFREAFCLAETEALIHVERIRSNDGTPFAHLSSWTREIGQEYSEEGLKKRPRLDLFKSCGIEIEKVEQTISASLCNASMASYLDYDQGQPLLTLTRYAYAPDGSLVDILKVHYRPDQFQYQMTMSGSQHG